MHIKQKILKNIPNERKKRKILVAIYLICIQFIFTSQASFAGEEIRFNNLESLFTYADKNSSVIKTGDKQYELAKLSKLAAIANIINFRNPVTMTMTDNTKLPVTFLPAQIFNGVPGTFRIETFGQEYVSNLNFTPQIDIINPGSWEKVNSSNINIDLTTVNNLINKKNLYESIAACYYNIISLQEQVNITKENLLTSDTLFIIVNNKYSQGISRQQDVNDAEINKLNVKDKLNQLQASLDQQYNNLKILFDVPPDSKLTISDNINYNEKFDNSINANSNLEYNYSKLKCDMAASDLQYKWLSQLPVMSLIYSNTFYQNSNDKFFDKGGIADWLNSNYIGLKLTLPLPDVNNIINTMNTDVDYKISQINLEHEMLKNNIQNKQMKLDYDKTYSQLENMRRIEKLKSENYKIVLNQYNESILSFDKVITAFNDMLTSRLNYSTSSANFLNAKTKIEINKRIK